MIFVIINLEKQHLYNNILISELHDRIVNKKDTHAFNSIFTYWLKNLM